MQSSHAAISSSSSPPEKSSKSSASSSSSSSSSWSRASLGVDLRTQLVKAINVLIKLRRMDNASCKRKRDLLQNQDDGDYVLEFSLQNINTAVKHKPLKIELPHAYYNENTDVCVITQPPQRKWKDIAIQKKIPAIKKVIDIKKLESKYKTHKEKSQLSTSFDLFICDHIIAPKMPSLLGKDFIKRKKLPVSMRIKESNLKTVVDKSLKCIYVHLPRSSEIVSRFARMSMTCAETVDNAERVIGHVVDFITAKNTPYTNTVLSISVRTSSASASSSMSLPVYVNPILNQSRLFHANNSSNTNSEEYEPSGSGNGSGKAGGSSSCCSSTDKSVNPHKTKKLKANPV